MKKNDKYLLIAFGVLALLLIPAFASGQTNIFMNASSLIESLEGFRPHPYWDVSVWSWGFGTRAPGPDGTITIEQARQDLQDHLQPDYDYLSGLITRPLEAYQWAALLSFSYNEGPGNADNLVDNINSGNDSALEVQWKKYIYAGGVINDTLVNRRQKEWNVWQGNV